MPLMDIETPQDANFSAIEQERKARAIAMSRELEDRVFELEETLITKKADVYEIT